MAVSKEDILESISNMSVMDVVELVEAMEEKFGVSAAAAVAVAAPAAAAADGFGSVTRRPQFIKEELWPRVRHECTSARTLGSVYNTTCRAAHLWLSSKSKCRHFSVMVWRLVRRQS